MALPAVREAYHYISEPACKRLGVFAWMATANILTEALIIRKYSKNEFEQPLPQSVKLFWLVSMSVLLMYIIFKFARTKQKVE
jgi:hypothetical protein